MTVPTDIKHIERPGYPGIELGLAFVSSEECLRAADSLRHRDDSGKAIRFLLESPVLYEAVRPFLEALQNTDPLRLPFTDYIKNGELDKKVINLPAYSTVPDFTWNLKVLLRDNEVVDECVMDPSSSLSIAAARQTLYDHGKLDPR
jgi:hypothetical protein